MYRMYSLVFISVLSVPGAASAQVPGRAVGDPAGAVSGAVNDTVNGGLATGSAVGGFGTSTTEGVRDGIAGAPGIANADAVSTMRRNAELSAMVEPLLPKGINATQAAAGLRRHEPICDHAACRTQHERSV